MHKDLVEKVESFQRREIAVRNRKMNAVAPKFEVGERVTDVWRILLQKKSGPYPFVYFYRWVLVYLW